jgi:hypothetical protein
MKLALPILVVLLVAIVTYGLALGKASSSTLHLTKPTLSKIQPTPKVYLLDAKRLAQNKQKIKLHDPVMEKAYIQLLKESDALLSKTPPAVTEKTQVPPNGDKHEYMSLATYAWPDESRSNGLPYKFKDGESNPENNSVTDLKNFRDMITWSHKLAIGYYFSDKRQYAIKSAEFIKVWFVNPKTRMKPDLNYAQAIKGKSEGSPAGIIDAQTLPQVIDSIGLINNSDVLSTNDKLALQEWFKDYLHWLETSKFGITEMHASNNIGTWYDLQRITISLYLNKNSYAKQLLENTKTDNIAQQINSDGSQTNELNRTRSWDYSLLNLIGLCNLAVVGENAGVYLWSYSTSEGSSIKKAIAFLLPYAQKDKNWPYKQITIISSKGLIIPLFQASYGYSDNRYSIFASLLNLEYHISPDELLEYE